MNILSITAQKPHSTGSGIYLTELVNNWHLAGHTQAVVAGIYEGDCVHFPKEVAFYPVEYTGKKSLNSNPAENGLCTDRDNGEALPFAITGMSDEMPYESVRYQDMTEEMLRQYREAFQRVISKAVEELNPDIIICHHIYLVTAMVREWYPDRKIIGISHGSDLRQICKNPLQRDYIKEQIRKLDGIVALHKEHKKEIVRIFSCEPDQVKIIGVGYNQNIFYKRKRERTDGYQIVFAGKVTEKKGVFSLLNALEKLPYSPDKLVVKIAGGYGQEEERRKIQEIAQKSRYRIDLPGRMGQKELAEVFCQSDVFVLPSFFEGLPLVNIEAMACGCKVVCSDIRGIKEWYDENVPGHNILFVPLPKMNNTDEPLKSELPQFEKRLAAALREKLEQKEEEEVNLEQISWKGISEKVLNEFY